MTENSRPDVSAGQGPPTDAETLREEIAETRAELGDTVEALAAKTDVKSRAQDKITEVKAKARDRATAVGATVRRVVPDPAVQATARAARAGRRRPVPVLAAGAVAVMVCVVVLRRRVARRHAGREGLTRTTGAKPGNPSSR